jgi:hypothetical protein
MHLKKLPKGCRAGNNAYAFIGGFRMWNSAHAPINQRREKTKLSLSLARAETTHVNFVEMMSVETPFPRATESR